ncbi:hypothetical protein KIW84_020851 [Lathyrus oleraceus]|uniref:Uncharacterized protein n=1 Tax=Pisum sativum TaxID=3888 RepID=A0A9D4YBU2_PEA|nr:hypothetical protein KIW84_020851 [Pisum sativum]
MIKPSIFNVSVKVWHTASLYHLVHTAALLSAPITKNPNLFGGLLTAGILAFSGTRFSDAPYFTISHTVKDVATWGEEVRSKDESVLLVCDVNNKEYGLFTKGTKSIKDMSPHNNEDVDLSGLAMKQVIIDKLGNTLLPVGEDESICDADTFGAISLRPRLSCILKLNLNQMDD